MTRPNDEALPRLDAADFEDIARGFHERYRRDQRDRKAATDAAMQPWESLQADLKDSNRALARDVPRKLAMAALRLRRGTGAVPFVFSAADVELLAAAEHERWNAERTAAGWRVGPRDPAVKTSPYLVPYGQLTEEVKTYDREAIRAIPDVLRAAGLEIVRDAKPHVFVARDFTVPDLETFIERAVELSADSVRWDVPGVTDATPQGHIFRDSLRDRIHAAHRVLVNLDQPNANVAYEFGQALGRGAEVALFHIGKVPVPPRWLSGSPFEGFGVAQVRRGETLIDLAMRKLADSVIQRQPVPARGRRVLMLAPREGAAADAADSLRDRFGRDRFLEARQPEWSWTEAASRLGDIGTILWLVERVPDTERDGVANTLHAAIAGYLTAFGDRQLVVFQHHEIQRSLADLGGTVQRYQRLEGLRAMVAAVLDRA